MTQKIFSQKLNLLFLLMGLCFSSFAQAEPQIIEGAFEQTESILNPTQIKRIQVRTRDEAKVLEKDGFTCQIIKGQYACRKLEKLESMPIEVSEFLRNSIPKQVVFEKAAGGYGLINESPVLVEWERSQKVLTDSVLYYKITWKELEEKITKIELKNFDSSYEFLWLGETIARLDYVNLRDPKTGIESQFWGTVLFRKK